jgi:N-acetylmuramic acid 6-phosphate etherase
MPEDFSKLPTEQSNPHSKELDALSTEAMLRVINQQDQLVPLAVERALPQIAAAVDAVTAAFRSGGRLRSFGAGTSGRIAILDASEMHPTFGISRDLIEGHLAGGPEAFWTPKEGAEDDPEAGAQMVRDLGIRANDAVIGLAASGRTPFVIGVLKEATKIGATTIAISCASPAPILELVKIPIAVLVGPEVLTGSTRMKSGTAQKLVLNMITTGAMVKMGYTYGNLMVAVTPTNEKLRARALGIVQKITGEATTAAGILEAAGFDVRIACLMIRGRMEAAEARRALTLAGGSLRSALQNIHAG